MGLWLWPIRMIDNCFLLTVIGELWEDFPHVKISCLTRSGRFWSERGSGISLFLQLVQARCFLRSALLLPDIAPSGIQLQDDANLFNFIHGYEIVEASFLHPIEEKGFKEKTLDDWLLLPRFLFGSLYICQECHAQQQHLFHGCRQQRWWWFCTLHFKRIAGNK